MVLSLFYVTSVHTRSQEIVAFLVVAKDQDHMGWPLLAEYEMDDFRPDTCAFVAQVPHEPSPRVVEYFGPAGLKPRKKVAARSL